MKPWAQMKNINLHLLENIDKSPVHYHPARPSRRKSYHQMGKNFSRPG
jgi:hypothetical protein